MKERYNLLLGEVFTDSTTIVFFTDMAELPTVKQEKLFEMFMIRLELKVLDAATDKEKTYYKNCRDFIETLVELPEAGRQRRILLYKVLAGAGLAILGVAVPGTIAAASDLAAHGLLQKAIEETIKQGGDLTLFNEKLLEVIHQVMPEFATIVTVFAVLGGAGVLAAALWPDNAPIRAIGDIPKLRENLELLELEVAKAWKQEQDKGKAKS